MPRKARIVTANEIIEEVVDDQPLVETKIEVKPKRLGNPPACGNCTSIYGRNWCLSCVIFKNAQPKIKE
jgi:hypothetical protein